MFTGVAALSLAMCVATVVLWVRSYWRVDYMRKVSVVTHQPRDNEEREWRANIANGGVLLYYSYTAPLDFTQNDDQTFHHDSEKVTFANRPSVDGGQPDRYWHFAGVLYERYTGPWETATHYETYIVFPISRLVVCVAVLPLLWTYKRMLRPHRVPGSCPICGYNLTGNVSGVCSECGKPIPSKA
jgi:hypothetical protein